MRASESLRSRQAAATVQPFVQVVAALLDHAILVVAIDEAVQRIRLILQRFVQLLAVQAQSAVAVGLDAQLVQGDAVV